MPTIDPSARAEFIAGLRRLAAFLAAHPAVPVPSWADITVMPRGDEQARQAAVDRIAELIGSPVSDSGNLYQTVRDFGPITYRALALPDQDRRDWEALMTYDGAVSL